MQRSLENDQKTVLYQKLGQYWYAFSQIDGEVIFTKLPESFQPSKIETMNIQLYEVVSQKKSDSLKSKIDSNKNAVLD